MASPPNNIDAIGNYVRYWVHYDNSIAAANKQIRQLREQKDQYEQKIIELLKSSSMEKPVIQIAGGRILVGEDKVQQAFTYTMLETMLNKYYASKPGSRVETKDILKFIREHRETQINPSLRRIMTQKTRGNSDDDKRT